MNSEIKWKQGFENFEKAFQIFQRRKDELFKKCEKIEGSFEMIKEKLKQREWQGNEILLIDNVMYYDFMRHGCFNPSIKKPDLDESNKGFFQFQGKDIEFKRMPFYEGKIGLMILDPSKLPQLELFDSIQSDTEHFAFEFLKDIGVSIGIDSFSSNQKLMTAFFKKVPEWLTKKRKEKQEQEDYLKQKVNIKISQGISLNWKGIEQIGTAFIIKK